MHFWNKFHWMIYGIPGILLGLTIAILINAFSPKKIELMMVDSSSKNGTSSPPHSLVFTSHDGMKSYVKLLELYHLTVLQKEDLAYQLKQTELQRQHQDELNQQHSNHETNFGSSEQRVQLVYIYEDHQQIAASLKIKNKLVTLKIGNYLPGYGKVVDITNDGIKFLQPSIGTLLSYDGLYRFPGEDYLTDNPTRLVENGFSEPTDTQSVPLSDTSTSLAEKTSATFSTDKQPSLLKDLSNKEFCVIAPIVLHSEQMQLPSSMHSLKDVSSSPVFSSGMVRLFESKYKVYPSQLIGLSNGRAIHYVSKINPIPLLSILKRPASIAPVLKDGISQKTDALWPYLVGMRQHLKPIYSLFQFKTPIQRTPMTSFLVSIEPLLEKNSLDMLLNDAYTIQLMTDDDEDFVAHIVEAYSLRHQIVCLDDDGLYYLIYGHYSSYQEAQQALENIPAELKKWHPYTLSVNEIKRIIQKESSEIVEFEDKTEHSG